MISAEGVKRYCEAVYAAKPVYVWGADLQPLTEGLLERLQTRFSQEYYRQIDLKAQEGLLGADCSGFLTPISGTDRTAAGYYASCQVRGPVRELPKDRTALLFREEKAQIVHVGIYTGDGMVYEMRNGCERHEFLEKEWKYYGIAQWIEQKKELMCVLLKETKIYRNAADAIAGRNAVASYPPGEYYEYKRYKTAVNVTKTKGVPGGWCTL